MIWAKRRFEFASYAPYQDRIEKLLMANAALYRQFFMVSTKTDDAGVSDYYVGAPNESFLIDFDGFERVTENDLPKEIDVFHIGDATTDEFKKRFRFRGS